jgi:site-specific DNA-methyltransferase (adenine-specific)
MNILRQGDCLEFLTEVESGSARLFFCDPPYNLGYQYDEYQDSKTPEHYYSWMEEVIAQGIRVLSPGGAFWIMAHTEWVAGIKKILDDWSLEMRNWIVWHYSFGQAQQKKFTPSWVSLLYYSKPPRKAMTFHADAIRVPSARQLVYKDKRANPLGKVPNDVWDDIPRLCGTHLERTPHPCQLPEALLERVIQACTGPSDLVIDPMCGSGTVLTVAKRLGRRYWGCELSPGYCRIARERLEPVSGPSSVGPGEEIIPKEVA